MWKNVLLPLITYRNVKIFLTALLLVSLIFLVFVLSTEGRGLTTENVSTVLPYEGPNKTPLVGKIATDTRNPHLHYGIVIDCGSSGSRVYVYFWPPHDGNPKELLNIQQMRDRNSQLVVMKVEPGTWVTVIKLSSPTYTYNLCDRKSINFMLAIYSTVWCNAHDINVLCIFLGLSEFRDRPSDASDYIRPLLDYAADQIPAEKHSQTPLYIMATAGLRMLPLA